MLSVTMRIAARRCFFTGPTSSALRSAVRPVRSRIATMTIQLRYLSSAEKVFGLTEDVMNMPGLPPIPIPPEPSMSIEELAEAGHSVLNELGLVSWWKPSGYFRMALEAMHNHLDLPWWTTIMCATMCLRLAMVFVPIMSQKLVAKQSMYKKELDEFRERIMDAKKEGNNLLQQQVFLEQRDFLKSKDIRLGRQFLIILANGGVFATQFFAIRRMVDVNFPGWSAGGALWFTDLTVPDPYYALPLISAVTMGIVARVGIEMGTSTDQMGPGMRLGMLYGLPLFIFVISSRFASGLCVYWCTSNFISLIYAMLFKMPVIRKVLNIPPVVTYERKAGELSTIAAVYKNYKEQKARPPTLEELGKEDARRFKKAGRGKPIVRR
uniref:Membrane insertase YidC/Oxa/ALB C-terminal domain-containing protein n=1 Tax=Parascaris univalens TaxID=6257 RepID=A0A915CIE6_PARUN